MSDGISIYGADDGNECGQAAFRQSGYSKALPRVEGSSDRLGACWHCKRIHWSSARRHHYDPLNGRGTVLWNGSGCGCVPGSVPLL